MSGPSPISACLTVKVVPGASQDRIAGWLGNALKIRVQAPPEKGKANAAIIRLVAAYMDVPTKSVSICSGQTSQIKVVEMQGITDADLKAKLSTLLQS